MTRSGLRRTAPGWSHTTRSTSRGTRRRRRLFRTSLSASSTVGAQAVRDGWGPARSSPRRESHFARWLPTQAEMTVAGVHYLQEDSHDRIGQAIAGWMETLG